MSDYVVSDTNLTAVADAIRTKGGTSAGLEFPAGFVSAIADIPSGGGGILNVGTDSQTITTVSQNMTFTGLSGVPKCAFLSVQTLTRSAGQVQYYVASIFWDGTNTYGGTHLRSGGSYTYVDSGKYSVTVNGTSITFTGTSSTSTSPGMFMNTVQYNLIYLY